MTRMILVFVSLLALAGVARADAPFTITTVDEFERLNSENFNLTGLVSGETTPRKMGFYTADATRSDSCERAALMMETHPGRFNLAIARPDVGVTCRLIRQVQ